MAYVNMIPPTAPHSLYGWSGGTAGARRGTWDLQPFRAFKITGIVLNIARGETARFSAPVIWAELEVGCWGREGQTGYLSYWFSKVETRRFRGAWLLKFPGSCSLLSHVAPNAHVNTHTHMHMLVRAEKHLLPARRASEVKGPLQLQSCAVLWNDVPQCVSEESL